MTVLSTNAYSTATGNGAATSFPFDFACRNTANIAVYVNSVLQTSGYSVTLNADFNGGSILFAVAPANLAAIMIASNPSFEQPIQFENAGPYNPEAVDGVADDAAIRAIWLLSEVSRAVVAPLGETLDPLPAATARANMFLAFDGSGQPIASTVSGEKGDPGANTAAIGLFTTASTLSIPVGTDAVRTSGYSSKGIGIADYYEDTTLNDAYVAANPRTSFKSSNGRYFRIDASDGISLPQVGGIGDLTSPGNGTVNDAALAAITAAQPLGGKIRIPQMSGAYRFSTKQVFTAGYTIEGEGWHENPGIVNGVTYIGIQAFPGSTLCFDSDVGGFLFLDFTSNNANATSFQYQSARHSVVSNLLLYSAGGVTTVDSHGIELRTTFMLFNVSTQGFGGCGFKVLANTSGAVPYGNSNCSTFRSCKALQNKLHGFHIDGTDANVIGLYNCASQLNGGAGYLDDGSLGNAYFSCHSATNNQSNGQGTIWTAQAQVDAPQLSDPATGSYIMSSAVAAHTYTGCYTESGLGEKAHLITPAAIFGGNLSSGGASPPRTSTSTAVVIGATVVLPGSAGSTKVYSPTGTSQFVIETGTGTFAELTFTTNGSPIFDILAQNGAAYISGNLVTWRNFAQTVVFGALSASGLLMQVPLGYGTGGGGTVLQTTSRSTAVTLNKPCGEITLFSAAGSAAWTTFTVNNSLVAATDTVRACQASGTDKYQIHVTGVRAGAFDITFATTGGTTTEQPVFNFSLMKGASS
jgi:hypothetical protein